MGMNESIDWDALEQPQEIAHEFEIDLRCLVTSNHKLTIEAIDQDEEKEVTGIEEELRLESPETVYSFTGPLQNFYDDLRRAARLQAMVALVTRLQHWISKFVKQRKLVPVKDRNRPTLVRELDALNKDLGVGPVPVAFFENIVTLRDSVIHGDAQAEWQFQGKKRTIAPEYANSWGHAEISEEQLQDVIQKAIQQVKWYDERMHT